MSDKRLLVGIDFSKHRADFALLSSTGELIEKHRGFANSQVGFQQAKQMLLAVLQEQHFASFDLAGEATSYYWLPMFIALCQDAELAPYDPGLFLLNARWVRKFKQSKSPKHKNDQVDPLEIADYIRFNRKVQPWYYDRRWLPLRFYTRLRFHLTKSLTREKNLFNLYLFLAHTTYAQRQPFADLLSQTSRRLLAQPELLRELEDLPVDEIAEHLQEQSHSSLPHPEKNANRLKQALQESFPVDEPLAEPIQRGLQLLLASIAMLESQIALIEDWITALVQSGRYPEVTWLESVPGVGRVLASGIAAEIGEMARFTQVDVWDQHHTRCHRRTAKEVADALSKYCGLWWKENSSGKFSAEERHMSREGNAYLRYYVLAAGERMRQRIPSFAAYYKHKYDQATKHKHKRALVLTGSKALDLFAALLRHQTVYRAKEGDAHLDA